MDTLLITRLMARVLLLHRSRAVLGAPVRSVDRDGHAGRCGARLLQRQASVEPVSREQAPALAHDDREDQQVDPVHQVVLDQVPEQRAAAVDLQLAARPRLEVADRLDDIAVQDPSCCSTPGP